jgi:hypothetical protein
VDVEAGFLGADVERAEVRVCVWAGGAVHVWLAYVW